MSIVRAGALALLSTAAIGAETAPPPGTGATLPPAAAGALERTRHSVRSAVEWLARGIDSWFGDQPFSDGGKVTDGILSATLLRRKDHGIESSVHANASLRLPNLERRAYLFVGRDNEREVVTDRPAALTRQQRLLPESADQTSVLAGIGLALKDTVDFRLGVRGGLKPYAQARWRRSWQPDPAERADLRETLFWTLDDHFGSTTVLSLEHGVSPTLGVRWLSAATITQVTRKFEWISTLGAYRSFGARRLLGVEALASGGQAPGAGISDAGLQLRWEQPIHQDWLIGEVVVGRFWPRVDTAIDVTRGWALGCGVKMLF